MSMIFAAVGDVHGDITKMYQYLTEWEQRTGHKLSFILHVGDFGVFLPKVDGHVGTEVDFHLYWNGIASAPIPTYVCPGNHESWEVLQAWKTVPQQMANIHLLGNGEITDVMGVKVGAIWGNWSPKSYKDPDIIERARRMKQHSPKKMHIHPGAVHRLKLAGKMDVLITHDAPAHLMKPVRGPDKNIRLQLGLTTEEKGIGCPGFNEIYETGNPTYHFFGHFHTFYLCKPINPTVICLHCFNYDKSQSVFMVPWGTEQELLETPKRKRQRGR